MTYSSHILIYSDVCRLRSYKPVLGYIHIPESVSFRNNGEIIITSDPENPYNSDSLNLDADYEERLVVSVHYIINHGEITGEGEIYDNNNISHSTDLKFSVLYNN